MGNRGRFGKYGDIKRVEKLRAARVRPSSLPGPRQSKAAKRTLARARMQKTRQLILRKGLGHDIQFVKTLSEHAFAKYGDYGKAITSWFDSGIAETLIAMWADRKAGFAMIGKTAELGPPESRFELLAIAVEEALRRKGIGLSLLKEVFSLAKSKGAKEVMLHTSTDNIVAMRLFQKAGFEIVGLQKGFYPRGQDAVVMMKAL